MAMDIADYNAINELRITLTFESDTPDGPQPARLGLPFLTFYHLYRAIHHEDIGPDAVKWIVLFGTSLPRHGRIAMEDIQQVDLFIDALHKKQVGEDEIWETREDPILSFSYHMLRDRHVTYKEAARYASLILGETISPDTWKQRVRRWAKRQNKPKVGLRKRDDNVTDEGVVSLSETSS